MRNIIFTHPWEPCQADHRNKIARIASKWLSRITFHCVHLKLSARQMCLFRSRRSCSRSLRSLVCDLSSLLFLALSILSKTSQLSLYCFLFPSKQNSGSGSLGLNWTELNFIDNNIYTSLQNCLPPLLVKWRIEAGARLHTYYKREIKYHYWLIN